MQVFHARTQKHEDVVWSTDQNDELLCTFADGHFKKFPAGITTDELTKLLALHEESERGQEVITEEVLAKRAAVKAANEALLAELNGGKDGKLTSVSKP